MSERKTLTLRPLPFVSSEKIKRTEDLGFRFIERKKRYILQARMVCYPEREDCPVSKPEHTWVDIPLVPEVYA